MNSPETRIQQLLDRLDVLQAKRPVDSVKRLLEEEASTARASVKQTPTGTALKMLAHGLESVQSDPRPARMLQQIESAKQENQDGMETLSKTFSDKVESLLAEVQGVESRGTEMTKAEIASILDRLAEYEDELSRGMTGLSSKNTLLESEVSRLGHEIPKILARLDAIPDYKPELDDQTSRISQSQEAATAVSEDLKEVEKRLTNRINNIQQVGGGNANRNIAIAGNSSVLSKYTDINLKPGSNVTITYTQNDQTKFTDITISASGGGGGSGITRSVNTVAVSTAAGALSSIDYVYLCSGTLTITLPTSVGNSNLYTIKNIGAGIVTVNTTGGETIDGDTTLIIPLQFTSVDLISNNSGNWDIT